MKKETLEEAAERYVEDFDLSFYDTVEEIPVKELGKKDFKEGAKWQQETSAQTEISDEEIEKGAEENTCYMNDFILGAKWYREQLKHKL